MSFIVKDIKWLSESIWDTISNIMKKVFDKGPVYEKNI